MTLKVAIEKPMRSKALLAIAFAGGMLNSQLPASSETETKSGSTDSIELKIAKNPRITPEIRALYLLRLAREYLNDVKKSEIEMRFIYLASESSKSWTIDTWEMIVKSWPAPTTHDSSGPKDTTFHSENKILATKSINLALEQLNNATDKYARIGLHFIAWRLFREIGNANGIKICSKALDADFEAYEENETFDEEKIRTTYSILNLLANSLIPVFIPDFKPEDSPAMQQQTQVNPYTESDFKESEMLRRRAVGSTDVLAPDNDFRRKAHRDLVLWYSLLGKKEMAEREKKILFELVGIEDDSILYPQSGFCGHLVWWTIEKRSRSHEPFCGMG